MKLKELCRKGKKIRPFAEGRKGYVEKTIFGLQL